MTFPKLIASIVLGVLLASGAYAAPGHTTQINGTKYQGTKYQGTKYQGNKFQGNRFQGINIQGFRINGTTSAGKSDAPAALSFNAETVRVRLPRH